MKISITSKDKKIVAIASAVAVIVLYFCNRMYVKITDIAYVNTKPYEIKIKCGFILPSRITMLLSNGNEVKCGPYKFKVIRLTLYKDGESVITFKTDDEYQKTKTSPLIRI